MLFPFLNFFKELCKVERNCFKKSSVFCYFFFYLYSIMHIRVQFFPVFALEMFSPLSERSQTSDLRNASIQMNNNQSQDGTDFLN